MGGMICEECNVYYEAEDESEAEDFLCQCGNQLIYVESLEDYYEPDDYIRERMSNGLTHTEYHEGYILSKSINARPPTFV